MVTSNQLEVFEDARPFEFLQFKLHKKGEVFSKKNSLTARWNRGNDPGDLFRSSPFGSSEEESGRGDRPEEKSLVEI